MVFRVDFFFERQWKQSAQIFVVQMQCGVFADVRWENGTVSTVQVVASWCRPMWQVFIAVVLVDNTELGDIVDA